ncbi:MDR family MFS transporter [Plantactinospora solaniradicis]|uniref:MDR family MFS transporter n=1 Tax=Plantactinospora solaniradicis TaxID=1723736 RepID=A0ABW1KAW1_9ACTN
MSMPASTPPLTEAGAGPHISRLAHRAIMVVLVPLMMVLFISSLDGTIVATALSTIAADLGDTAHLSWVATAYLLTSAISTLLFGKLGDMYGRKRIFQISIGVFLIGSILCGLAQNMLMLILFRGLQGIGGGGLNSLVMAITGDLVPARQRAKYQAYTGIVATVALIAGPLFGGFFADHLSWHWIFYINVPIGVAAIVAVGARLHLPRPTSDARVDILGGILAALLTTAIMLVTTWGGSTYAWTSPTIIALIAGAVALLIAYVITEHRAAEPITPLRLFRNGVFTIASAQFLLATLALFVGMLYVPLFMQTVQHHSAFVAGLYVIPLLVGLIAATAVAGPVIARSGRYKVFPVVGAVLTGVSMWVVSLAGTTTGSLAIIVPLFLAGAGIGLLVQVALLAGQNAVAHRHLGVATGALNFFKSIGGAFGAALFGAILTARLPGGALHAFHTVFLWTVPFMVVSFVLGLVMREKPLSEEMIEVAQGKTEVPEY